MPPALHPRSTFTTSLFGTTLALCFLVVGLPHLIPCPIPHAPQLADGQMEFIGADGRRYRRRLAPKVQSQQGQMVQQDQDVRVQDAREVRTGTEGLGVMRRLRGMREEEREDEEELRRKGRECPVPKPAGVVGRMLGFKKEEERARPVVRIEDGLRIARRENESSEG